MAERAIHCRSPVNLLVKYNSSAVLSVSVFIRALQVRRAAESHGQLAGDFRLQFDDHQADDSLDESSVR